jgi:peptide chain release factor 1
MKSSLTCKLDNLVRRHHEIAHLMGTPEVLENPKRLRNLGQERAQLDEVVTAYAAYTQNQKALRETEAMLEEESDPDMKHYAQQERQALQKTLEAQAENIQWLLVPTDPNDTHNVYLEVRAGTGGDEAALFAGDLYRAYARYAENQGWKVEVASVSHGEHGGYKEIIARISGKAVYGQLKFESGAHRVQRVPATESQGRVHTSACTVAVMPEVDQVDAIAINAKDLRVDTFRASGSGGQHVNKTDSAIRLTHLPTGVVVECQEERSQHKNRARAMALLQSRILQAEQDKQASEQAEQRKALVGSGDRSERIRTYNYPQGRVTDHRIQLTLYQLDDIMEGQLDAVIQPLLAELKAQKLTALED